MRTTSLINSLTPIVRGNLIHLNPGKFRNSREYSQFLELENRSKVTGETKLKAPVSIYSYIPYPFSSYPPFQFSPLIIPTFTHYSQSNIAVVDDSIIFSISPRPHNSFYSDILHNKFVFNEAAWIQGSRKPPSGKTSDEEVYTVREKATK
ncbi:hypothetical protein CDAR_201451 [Caerostris darwini]|uniref:Uncharacterized protein n=1 Tax=Caerostris darwini TaxID=1538125 RepID=A0AAV4WEV1_9ARAC|nr:hypothetical protein CDAR_201451 [Caerostris darwini]